MAMPKICKICLANDILCQACNSSMASGKIKQIEVDVSRILHKLGIGADFIKAVYNGMVYVLADKKNARMLIGRNGANSRRLESALQKKVRIIENSAEKEIIESVLGTKIIGVNILYSPKEQYKIRVQKIFRNRIKKEHAAAISGLLDRNYEVVLE